MIASVVGLKSRQSDDDVIWMYCETRVFRRNASKTTRAHLFTGCYRVVSVSYNTVLDIYIISDWCLRWDRPRNTDWCSDLLCYIWIMFELWPAHQISGCVGFQCEKFQWEKFLCEMFQCEKIQCRSILCDTISVLGFFGVVKFDPNIWRVLTTKTTLP